MCILQQFQTSANGRYNKSLRAGMKQDAVNTVLVPFRFGF